MKGAVKDGWTGRERDLASREIGQAGAVVQADRAKRTLLGIEIPRDELALQIAAKCIALAPPANVNATKALDEMNIHPGASGDGMGEGFRRAADAAVIFFHECINAGRQPS